MKNQKLKKLETVLKRLRRVVVAYSGGLDSTFLLKMAVDTLGKRNVLAVTARSETYPDSEYREAVGIAKDIGARHMTIATSELKIKNFRSNPVNRCYYCKMELFKKLSAIAVKNGFFYVLDGTNHDDLKDIRYGRLAAKEIGVKSPLLEAHITKRDIRKFSKALKLRTWDKPAFACLASRIPFGSRISTKDLNKIEAAEDFLRRSGFDQVRVRLHKDMARIEILPQEFGRAIRLGRAITERLKSMGFSYISLDLTGYRTGSMNEIVRRE